MLRAQAATLLESAGNAAAEATLRKVEHTLSALAAAGTMDLNLVLAVQEPLAILHYTLCAVLLLRLPVAF